jgi:site-specific DNA-cytosine methylase
MIDEGVHGVVKLDADKLAPAVRTGRPAVLHCAEDRCLNVRENAALQGFPSDYEFFGCVADKYRQVGNAVPLKLATAIARSVKDSLEYEYEEESEMPEPMCDIRASSSSAALASPTMLP